MTSDTLNENIQHMREITKEIYTFTNQLDKIKTLETKGDNLVNQKEKKLLEDSIVSLTNQLKILNDSIPELINRIGFYKKLIPETPQQEKTKLVQLKYQPKPGEEKKIVVSEENKNKFIENLSKSSSTIQTLEKKYAIESKEKKQLLIQPKDYAKISNRFFRKWSNLLIVKNYFDKLNKDLRKISSTYVIGTYVSMIFSTIFLGLIIGFIIFVMLLIISEGSVLINFFKYFLIIPASGVIAGVIIYTYPASEGKNLGKKIDQELPFVAIHMSAIATSGVETLNIFKIILKNKEYKYSNRELKKLMNLINFHGEDMVTALKKIAKSSPSFKLKELLDGLATAITSGGNLHQYLSKHADTLLFDYKLEREKYTKVSETFMDIYISIVIAAPMILIMLFTIMGSTGALSSFLGLSSQMLNVLIILAIVVLNMGFLTFLKLKQPSF